MRAPGKSDSDILDAILAALNGSDGQLVHSDDYEAARVIKPSAGRFLTLRGYNSGPDQFIQIHDAAAIPSDGAKPVFFFKVKADTGWSLPFEGEAYAQGIVACNSSTGPTKTVGAADCWFVGRFR